MKNKLRIDFDLPTNHLKGQNTYVPPKARTSTEIERRHEMPHGSLILEQQHLGARIGELLLNKVQEPEDVSFVTRLLAAAGLNTSWYNFAQTDEVMRRRLKLPTLAYGYNEVALTEDDLLLRSSYQLSEVSDLARRLTAAHKLTASTRHRLKIDLGRASGNTALSVNCIRLGGNLEGASMYMAQEMARTASLGALQMSQTLASELRYPASIAQLPDPDSDLAVHIRRTAPNNVYAAYDEAISHYAIAR